MNSLFKKCNRRSPVYPDLDAEVRGNGSLRLRFILLALMLAWFGRDGARGQQKQPVSSLQEDCGITFNFTGTGTSQVIDNRQAGCLDWLVTYSTTTTVTVISLAFENATDLAGSPGTWSNYAGTLSSGINPNTAVTSGGAVTEATGPKYAFLRMNLSSFTGPGTVQGKLYGWKRRPVSVTISGGSVVITGVTPCTQQALANLSASGNTQLIAASGVTSIKVCQLYFSTTATEDIKLTYGTGANCATGTTDLTGLFKNVISGLFPFNSFSPLIVPAGKALCFNQSAAQANGIEILYVQN